MNLNKQGIWSCNGIEKTLTINNQQTNIISGFTEGDLTKQVKFYKIQEIEAKCFYQI